MKCQDITEKLEELSPAHFAQDWDNVGLLVGRPEKEIRSVYVALDATDDAIEEAVKLGVDLIITHHPMIFKGIKQVRSDHLSAGGLWSLSGKISVILPCTPILILWEWRMRLRMS